MKKILLAIILMAGIVSAQVSYFTPEKPKANDTITITYDPYAPHSRFSINDEVYAIIRAKTEDGKYFSNHYKMKRGENTFTYKYMVEDKTSYLNIYFITLSQNSFQPPPLEIAIYTPDNIPCRNAMLSIMHSGNYMDCIRKEKTYYPQNLLVYRNKWSYDKYEKPDSLINILSREIEMLEQHPADGIDKLYSLAFGYLLLSDYEKVFSIIDELTLMENPEYNFTLSICNKIFYKISNEEKNEEVKSELTKIVNQLADTKESTFTLESLSNLYFLLSDSAKINCCRRWLETDRFDPRPYNYLAFVYNKLSINLEEAESLVAEYIDKLLKGHLRFTSDISGKTTSWEIPYAYFLLAEISFKLDKYRNAIMAVKACEGFDFYQIEQAFELEGNTWFELKDYKRAEEAYILALNNGLENAKELIKNCYQKTRNSDVRFEEHFQKITSSGTEKPGDKTSKTLSKKAPDFNVTTIDGKIYSSESLKGKVIVLNFWSMGCGPCRAEFPQLNKLVDEYKGKDVVFLGLTGDENKNLMEKFFKKFTFKFEIAPNAHKIFKDYEIVGLPVSFVIDKEGYILKRFDGASEDIEKKIKILIDRVL